MTKDELDQLTSLSGQPLKVTLTDKQGKQTDFRLAPLVPMDWVIARQELIADRQAKFIPIAAMLDPVTKAKALAEMSLAAMSKADLMTDAEGSVKLLELSARRGGFTGNWLGFLNGLQDTEVLELQNKLLAVCGYKVEEEKEGNAPPFGQTVTAP